MHRAEEKTVYSVPYTTENVKEICAKYTRIQHEHPLTESFKIYKQSTT